MASQEIEFFSDDAEALFYGSKFFTMTIFDDAFPEEPAKRESEVEKFLPVLIEDCHLKGSPVTQELPGDGAEEALTLLGRKANLLVILIQDPELISGLPVYEEFDGLEDLLDMKKTRLLEGILKVH